ncbi:MAG: hypothetical protein LBJ58_05345 [Tannerellaceae bacterium]|jgi:hypothetical protein|nr:hypothetical protein [Tannerellaceae bacterium]
MMENDNNFNRLLLLLLITLVICAGLYGLPETIFRHKIKKVDIFADIRVDGDAGATALDSLRMQLADAGDGEPFVEESDSTESLPAGAVEAEVVDSLSVSIARRDSISRIMSAAKGISDPKGERIEDYSPSHTGMQRFFSALNHSRTRTVRIAFMGDSFIEGDIMVADFRSSMQQEFGGHGVGFVPVATTSPQYRPTVNQQTEGWKTYSIVNNKAHGYTLSGMMFEAKSEQARLSFATTTQYAALKRVNALKFLYDRNEATTMQFVYNLTDTIACALPPTQTITQYELGDTISDGSFTFASTAGFRAVGLALEDRTGVVVDNYSLRGNSGLVFEQLDPAVCASLCAIRPYDLIVLQYGLNAMDENMLDYGWYGARMGKVIRHLQLCFPDTDILMFSIPDRANQYNGTFGTMPAVLALLHTQRQTARAARIPFWNMFGAMGGENSMTGFVDKGWAGKDYTHLTFRGGREIARSFMKALMREKEFYDGM